jgi:hypothetical protein
LEGADAISDVVVELHNTESNGYTRFSDARTIGTTTISNNPYAPDFSGARRRSTTGAASRPERGRQYRR